MFGIAKKLLPRGSWTLLPKVYDDAEKAQDAARATMVPGQPPAKFVIVNLGDLA